MRSAIIFDGEPVPQRHETRIWDTMPPLGTNGFKVCLKEGVFKLHGTYREIKETGIQATRKEVCGEETHFIVIDPPIIFLQINPTMREYCTKCICDITSGTKISKEDPRYQEAMDLLLSYIWSENDIEFYRK